MKRYALAATVLALLTLFTGCSKNTGPASTASPANTTAPSLHTTVVMPTPSPSASPTSSAIATPEPSANLSDDDDDEQTTPPQTPWVEPTAISYTGKYSSVAADKEVKKYPVLSVKNSVQTEWGTMMLPIQWSIEDNGDGTYLILDAGNRSVGMLYQVNSYNSEPYFGLKPDSGTLISWEALKGYPYAAKAMTLECDNPTVLPENTKTVIRIVCILSNDVASDDDGLQYSVALCMSFDKAYIKGNKTDYVLSNATIDEIAKSVVDGLEK